MLSVIICTYNRVNLLKEALASVLGQKTNFQYEVIVGDDCSSDDTRSFLHKYHEADPGKVVLSLMQENSGIGANWATALKKAQGRYIAFLDDDDYWTDKQRMQHMVDFLETHPECNLLYTNGYTFNESTGKRKLIVYPELNYPDIHEMWRGKQPCIQLNMMMVRKNLIDECINLDDYIKYRFPIQDWNTNILLLRKAHCVFLDMPTCELRLTEDSLSRPKAYEQVQKKYERESKMCKYLAEQFPDDPLISWDETECNQYINHILATVAFKRGDYHAAKYYTKLSGGHSLRDKCTQTWITFQIYRLARIIRSRISD